MQRRKNVLIIMSGAILSLLLIASPLLVGYAQEGSKVQKRVNKKQQQAEPEREARQALEKSVVGSVLFDLVTARESEWTLQKAYYSMRHAEDRPASTDMSYVKGSEVIHISIMEFSTAKDAAGTLDNPRSMGATKSFNEIGDEGQKVYVPDQGFVAIEFRKGNFSIRIGTKDEKTAERFAKHAVEAVNGFAIK